jgi:ATP/maltotriose-dependent transcriptional regulator MalT
VVGSPGVRVRADEISAGAPLTIPASKFGCPAVPARAIRRPRLADVLAQPDWRTALVTGGPATGKTVSVAQWYESLGGTARDWVTLDSDDDRPERFWLTLVLALERAARAFSPTPQPRPWTGSGGPPSFSTVFSARGPPPGIRS